MAEPIHFASQETIFIQRAKGFWFTTSLCEDYFTTEGGDYYRKERYGDKKFNELSGGVC